MFHGDVFKGAWMCRYQVKFLPALSLLVIRQWGYQSLTKTETQVSAPIACTFLQGVASDIGNSGQNPAVAIGIGFNGTQTIYLRADASASRSVGSHYVIIGKAL